jgi:starvation-inducible DNA-binding protein
MDDLIEAMKVYFASNFQYYTKSHGFHVNVVGDDFYTDHKFFQKIYEDSQDAIDDIAEHIRAIDAVVPFAGARILELSVIKDCDDVPDSMHMREELYADTDMLIQTINICHQFATTSKLYGLLNFLEARIDAHNKFCWMLRASITADQEND